MFAPAFRLVDIALAAVVVVAWLLAAILLAGWRPRTSLAPAFAATLGAFVVGTATSVMPRVSVEVLAYAVVVVALYALLVRLQAHSVIGPRLGSVPVALLVVIAALYLDATVRTWLTWWELVGRVAVPPLRPGFESLAFGNPSALAATCVLLLFASVGHLGLETPARRAAAAALGATALTVAIVSGARSVWLGLAGATVVLATAWVLDRARRQRLAELARRRRVIAGVIAGGIAVALVAMAAAPAVLVRIGFGDPYRPGYWLASLRMAADRPLVGQGLGTWPVQRASFTAPTDLDFYVPHAHNVYLQTIGELGLVGGLAAVVLAATVIRLIRQALRGTAEQRRYGWAAVAAVGYILTHQLVDVVTNLPAILVALALIFSRLDALEQMRGEGDPYEIAAPKRLLLVPAAALLSIGLLGRWTLIATEHGVAVSAANGLDWQAAAAGSRAAVTADDVPPYRVTLGLALARTGEAREAASQFAVAAQADDFPQSWLALAALELEIGNTHEATIALDRALRLGIQQPSVAIQSAVLWLELGKTDLAVKSIAGALQRAPSLGGDDWWNRDATTQQAYRRAVDQVIAQGGPSAFRLALETGRLDDAARQAADPDGGDGLLDLVVQAWNGDRLARKALESLAVERPLDLEVVGWNAIVADRVGDDAARTRFRLWADLINGGAGSEAVGYRIVESLAPDAVPVGTFGLAYGQYLYGRPVPIDQAVLGLPQLVYR